MKRYATLLGLALFALIISGCDQYDDESFAQASGDQAGLVDAGRDLYQTGGCAGCHGIDGKTPALGFSRIIADIDDLYDLQNALYALRAGAPGRDQIMINQATDLSDDQIEQLAAFISTL